MERRIKRSTVACLLAIGGWSSLQADERFIVQPKRRADTAVVPQKPDAVRWEAADTLWTAPERAGRERSIAGDGATARLATLAPPLELPGQQIEAALRADDEQAAGQSAPLAGQPTTGKLRWVARGSDPRPSPPTDTHWNSPAVLSTPPQPSSLPFAPAEFPTVPTVAPFAVAAAEVQPITVAIAEPQAPLPATVPHEEIAPKKVLAALVSSQIIAGGPVDDDEQRLIAPVDRPPGWQAVGRELSERLAKCESLINRKAYFSAREDAEAAMLHLVRVLDLLSNRYESEPAWHAARRAMLEAEDFSTAQRLTSDNGFLRRLILSHETPVLKDADVAPLAPLTAAQHYRLYAEQKLCEAAQGHPWASEVLYTLGRTYQAEADMADDQSRQALRWKAATLYRSARTIAPSNALAANQLGYVLLQMDRPADAREVLLASYSTQPSLAALENLIEASGRLGDNATHQWAMQNYQRLQRTAPPTSQAPPVVEVDPQTFVALSPYTIGPPARPGGVPNPTPHYAPSLR